jgi:4-amino-4-deoxy-L-arabinose transferase-like glycosyltransferase
MTPTRALESGVPMAKAWILALAFAGWCLTGVGKPSLVDTDAARHAMNGVFLLDLVRSGGIAHPIQYAERYYSRYPAISIPYHPPLFPACEALLFWIFGVSPLVARMAVAGSVALSAILFFRLVWYTSRSELAAFGSVTVFLAAPLSQRVASDVMLEFPAMAMVLAAVLCLARFVTDTRWRDGLAFSLFAAAGIWTKQTVFLGLLPLVYIVLSRRWGLWRLRAFWASLAIVGVSALGLAAVGWSVGWSGLSHFWGRPSALAMVGHNLVYYYVHFFGGVTGGIAAAIVFLFMAAWLLWRRGRNLLQLREPSSAEGGSLFYAAWILSVLIVLLPLPAYNPRYLFFAYPPAAALLFQAVLKATARLRPAFRYAIVAAILLAIAIPGLQAPHAYLAGPAEAAAYIVKKGAKRILYLGWAGGQFIFALRALDPLPGTMVLLGDKIPLIWEAPQNLPASAEPFGVEYLIVEQGGLGERSISLTGPLLQLERVIPQMSSDRRFDGRLLLYRLRGSRLGAHGELDLPIAVLGRPVKARF